MTARKRFLSLAVTAVAALVLAAPSDGALGQCPGGTTSATALPFPQYTVNVANDGVVAFDNYVYALGVYGMTRTSIANPDAPGPISQLAQVGLDRTTCPTNPLCNGGKVVVDCDCHSGGVTMAVAEGPNGDSRLVSDWEPYYENQAAMTAFQAARGLGASFDFAQQVNVSPGAPRGSPLAAIYLPSGKYFAYIPSGSGVRSVDLTVTTGATGQTCDGGYVNCHTDVGQALQGTATLMPAASGLWAGQAIVGGQTKYILVGAGGPSLTVAFIDPTTGVPTPIGSVTLTTSPYQIAIATVKGGAYIFSGEYLDGIHVYEIRADNSIVEVQQPPELQGIYKNVVVKGTPGSPTPLLFAHKSSPASVINVFDTNWLTPGSSFGGTPRLGASFPHLGNFINGSFVGAAGFGAKAVQAGSIVYAYVFQVVNTSPEKSIASTKKDVSCIAADPLAPPFASFVMTNLTAQAQSRVGTNYYADRWRIQDTTSTGAPLTGVEWQLIAPDLVTTPPLTAITPNPPPWSYTGGAPVPLSVSTLDNGGTGIIWPCDPAIGGNPLTGAGCFASLGAPGGPSFVYDIKDRSTNPNPPPSIAANSQTVLKPTVYVNGQTGNPAPLPIQVLSGAGVLNALGSPTTQGNTAEATFSWTFTCSGSCPPQSGVALTQINPLTSNVTAFQLGVTYKDGTPAATVSGSIVQKDLIVNPGFSLAPATVLTGGTLTLTNLMQKAPGATITAVNYAINQGATPIASGSLNSNFFVVNGTDSIGVPAAINTYTIALTYIYNGPVDGNGATQVTPAQSFSVTTFTPNPLVNVFLTAGGYPNFVQNPQFGGPQLVIGNTYYLQDYEAVPPTVGHPGAQYYFVSGGIATPVGNQTSPVAPGQPTPTVPFVPAAACPSGCFVRAVVQGVTNDEPVTIVTTATPLSVSVTGPTSATPGVGVQFTANATGGQAPYSYFWDCDVQFLPNFVPGSAIQPCTYATSGFHNVQAKVVDNLSNAATSAPFQINVGGGGGGGLGLTLGGPTTGAINQSLTFTASATGGSGGYTYTWKPGESPLFEPPTSTGTTPSYSHTYTAAATYVVICQVTSGGSTAQATRTVVISGVAGPPAPSSQYTVSGATLNGQNYDVEAGRTITLTASELPANVAAANGYTWDFADGSPKHGQQVTYVFPATGARAVSLTVVGDGVHRSGTATTLIPFNVIPPSFQALMVPSAEHSAVFADPTGALKFWATDISVVNQGTAPVTVSPAFLSFTATQQPTFDLSTIPFDPAKKVTIPARGIWSQVDIVKMLAGEDANKGTLVLKYEGGDATPLATSRVYFAPASDPLGPSSGSAIPSVKATKDGQVVTQGAQVAVEQALPGLRGDAAYYFRVNLFNSASIAGVFRLSAVDELGNAMTITDPRNGTPSSYVDFPIGPYQAVDWSNDSLGLNDPAKRYVLKARRAPDSTTGRLIATAASRDRFTRDQVLITSDAPPELRENCSSTTLQQCVNYILPGASRFQSPSGAHWRTGLSIYNPSQTSRGIGLEYRYQDPGLANAEKLVTGFAIVGPGKLAYWDDVVSQVFSAADATLADPENGTAGVLKAQHFADGETTTSPLIISARNYDDQPAGTVGSQLSVYTQPLSLGPTDPAQLLAGLQADMTDGSNPKPRFETIVSVFAYDDLQTVVRLTSLKNDGTVLGSHDLALNQPGASGHFQPRNLSLPAFNAVINEPVTIKVEVLSGGRIGAYALVRDITTRDPTYVQARPQ